MHLEDRTLEDAGGLDNKSPAAVLDIAVEFRNQEAFQASAEQLQVQQGSRMMHLPLEAEVAQQLLV